MNAVLCTVEDSGWRPDASRDPQFTTSGRDLSVELRRWNKADSISTDGRGEEMGAVLEGRFELTCGDERYELAAGMGILIPANEPHVWRVLSDDGVLYRVSKK